MPDKSRSGRHPASGCQGACKLVPRAPETYSCGGSDLEVGSVQTDLIDTSRASAALEPSLAMDQGDSSSVQADTTGVEAHDRYITQPQLTSTCHCLHVFLSSQHTVTALVGVALSMPNAAAHTPPALSLHSGMRVCCWSASLLMIPRCV